MENPSSGKKIGRPEGAISKLSREAREKARETGLLPHEFLLAIARGERITRKIIVHGKEVEQEETYDFDKRVDAAKAAAAYYAPKISTVEVISGVSDDDLDAIIARAAAEAGVSLSAGGEGQKEQNQERPRSTRKHVDWE